MKPIITHPEADEELIAQIRHYKEFDKELAKRFRTRVLQKVRRIRRQPNFYPLYEDTACQECPVKSFPVAIYYTEERDHIWIVAYANQYRRPGYWLNRLRRQ